MRTRSILMIFYAIIISLIFTECFGANTPPDVDSMQNIFDDNYGNIEIVVDYMIDTGYENIYILDVNGRLLVDLTEIQIEDDTVVCAINKLIESGTFIDIRKRGNTIVFQNWDGILDIGCGIAYSINNEDNPEIQFLTELVPLSEAGWFYYLYDYNSWRVETEDG